MEQVILDRRNRRGTGIETGTVVIPARTRAVLVRGLIDEADRSDETKAYHVQVFVSPDAGVNWTSVGGGSNPFGMINKKGVDRARSAPCLRIESEPVFDRQTRQWVEHPLWPGMLLKAIIRVEGGSPYPVSVTVEFIPWQ